MANKINKFKNLKKNLPKIVYAVATPKTFYCNFQRNFKCFKTPTKFFSEVNIISLFIDFIYLSTFLSKCL